MKIYFLFYTFVCCSLVSNAQNTDSLKQLLLDKSISDKQEVDVLLQLSKNLMSEVANKDVLFYLDKTRNKALELGEKDVLTSVNVMLAEVYMRRQDESNALKYAEEATKGNKFNTEQYLLGVNILGRVYHHFQHYEKAITTYQRGIEKYKERPEGTKVATICINQGISWNRLGKHDKEMTSYLEGLRFADSLNDKQSQNFAKYTIAYAYYSLGEFAKSEYYFLKGLEDSLSNNISIYTQMNFHGLGQLYSDWNKFEKSIKYNELALKSFKEHGMKLYEFDVLNNMAVLYYRMDSLELSIKYGNLALDLATELNHKLAISGATQTLANTYLRIGDLNKSQSLYNRILPNINDPLIVGLDSKKDLLGGLSELYEKKGNYKLALRYQKEMKEVSDTIINREKFKYVTSLNEKYQSEKKERELEQERNKVLSKDVEIQKKASQNAWLFMGLSLALASMVILLFVANRRKKRLELEKERFEKEVLNVENLKLKLNEKDTSERKLQKELEKEKLRNASSIESLNLDEFHSQLQNEFGLTDAVLEFWILQVEGLSDKEMEEKLFVGNEAIKSRRKKLYSEFKLHLNLPSGHRYSRVESIKLYREKLRIYWES